MVSNNMTSQLLQETTVDRMIVCNGCLQFYEENLYNFVKYCENIIKNTNFMLKNIWGLWDWVAVPFMIPYFAVV